MLPPHDEWVSGNSAGPYTSPVDKFLIHTTEGTSIEGAVAAYRSNNSWPHLTVECRIGKRYRRCGHLDLSVAARSLKNMSGGVETNTDGVIQVEVVGSALSPEFIDWTWFALNVIEPICQPLHIPCISPVDWPPYPDSYGKTAEQRLSPGQWTSYSGILGHMHAPENDHGDPGSIPIDLILAALPTGDDELTPDDRKWIEETIAKYTNGLKPLIVAYDDVSPGEPDHWYSMPAQTRSEVTRDEATQAVAQGNARWWDPKVAEPVRVPRATLDQVTLVADDAPAADE